MSFLQPALLYALPLIGLPILIHLINRRRHRTIPWAAMMFLLDAQRLTRSMAKLRYWLIMAMRMAAIGALLFAASRPLASGWLGLTAGSQGDTTILVLDRSASMQQRGDAGKSKRETALAKLTELLETIGGRQRVVLIENTRCEAQELEGRASLEELTETTATDTASDLPSMVQAALDYLVVNNVGQADVWIASDRRENDWQPDDGRWAGLRQGFAQREGIRFHLLTYPQLSQDNVAVSLRNVRKRKLGDAVELVLDVDLRRETNSDQPRTLPVEFVVNGARSVINVEMGVDEFTLQGHVIPLDAATVSGWGRVEIPGDDNSADNVFYFVFADEPQRFTTIVSDDPLTAEPLRIAAAATPDPTIELESVVWTSDRIGEVDWARTSLLVWQVPLPDESASRQLTTLLGSGRPIIFFPPVVDPGERSLLGVRWVGWETVDPQQPMQVSSWNGDSDLLARSLSGAALPIGELRLRRYCRIGGVGASLARLSSGDPLVLRADGELPAYFCGTLPRADYSSLASDGVMLYVMLQRALALGAAQQGDARQIDAGSPLAEIATSWQLLSSLPEEAISTSRPYLAAAYRDDDQLLAINRPTSEDNANVASDEAIARTFAGLDYRQINEQLGESSPLANEIWRAFLTLMAAALIVEALLCLT